MPSLEQLPEAVAANPTDMILLDQQGHSHSVTVSALQQGLQPKLTLAQGALLGRVSVTPGLPEPVAVGHGLTLNHGAIATDPLLIAPLASPSFSGTPTAPTPVVTDSSNALATTAFVQAKTWQPLTLTGDVTGAASPAQSGMVNATLPTITSPGTFSKVTVNAKGQVIGGGSLTGSDFVDLDLSTNILRARGATQSTTLAARAGIQLDAVLDFGADPTGNVDSTANLQAGIAALVTAGGGTLRLAGTFKISATLNVQANHIGLIGLGTGHIHADNSWTAPSRLIWAGPAGGTMVNMAPVANTTSGKALHGVSFDGILLDCNALAAVGLYIGSVRFGLFDIGYLNPLAGTNVQAAVVFDTVDIAEYNDTQHNEISIRGAELGSGGRGVLLQAKSRACTYLPVGSATPAAYYGNTSYNHFRDISAIYWRGVPLTLRETDNNVFDQWGFNGPMTPPTPPAYPGAWNGANCNSIEIEGSSDPVWGFPALNNIFVHGGCAGPIYCRGKPSFSTPSGNAAGDPQANIFLYLDKGNGVGDPIIETGAFAYFGDLNFTDNGRAITQGVLSDTRAAVKSLRSLFAAAGPISHATTGPAHRLVSPAFSNSWGLSLSETGALTFTPGGTGQQPINLGTSAQNPVTAFAGITVGDPQQSRVNLVGAPNGVPVTLRAVSTTTTDSALALAAQGSATTYFTNSHGIQFQVSDSGGPAVNLLSASGGMAGAGPRLQAYGADANIDVSIGTQGTGLVRGPTAPSADNSSAFATTAYVRAQSYIPSVLSGTAGSFTSTWTAGNPGNGAFHWTFTGAVPSAGVIGPLTTVYNNGPHSAQAEKFQYFSQAGAADSVDNAQTLIGIYNPTSVSGANMGAELVRWTVGITPQDTTHNWTHVVEELNVVNRGLDMGWKAYRNDPVNNITGPQQITGIHNYSPEATGLGQSGEGKNLLFAELFGESAALNSTGLPARFYNASLYEPNCVVGGTGRAIYINGDLTGLAPQIPYAPLEVNLTWLHGLRTTTATFQDGQAFTMASGQSVAWSNGTSTATIKASGTGVNQDITLTPAGTGTVRATTLTTTSLMAADTTGINLATSQGTVLQVKDTGSAALTKLVVTPGNGGTSAILALSGETNQGLNIRAAGSGQINFQSSAGGSTNQLTILSNPTAVNALSVIGGSTGQNVVLGVNGADANVSIQIAPLGTGTVYINKLQGAGGTIDATAIGAATPSTGAFTTLKSTDLASFAAGFADASYSTQTPTTGFSIIVPDGVSTLQLTPEGTLASGTITMPSSPGNGQWLLVTSTATVTACTFTPASGQTILGAPTQLPAYVEMAFQYQSGTSRWVCQSGNDSRVASVATTAALMFGTGADGAATISSGTITLTRDMHYTNLTLSGTGAINPAGWRLFVSGTLDLSAAAAGAIAVNGVPANNASGASGGAASGGLSQRTVGQSPQTGGAGGAGSTGIGSAGTTGASTTYGNGGNGGAAGAGGSATSAGGAAGAGGTETVQIPLNTPTMNFWLPANNASLASGLIGGGGGGGGGDGTNAGGGGGSGGSYGGIIALYARNIQRGANATASLLQAKGSNGGAGANGVAGNAAGGGGGGGGGGGLIYIVTEALLGTAIANALDVSGGTGGAGGTGAGTGHGGNGGTGGAGGSIQIVNLVTPSFTTSAWNTAGTAGSTTSTIAAGAGGAGAQVRAAL